MSVRVAITSSDGKVIDQHFGQCSEFLIAELRDDGAWKITENRKTEQTCHSFSHDEEHVQKVVEILADCSYLVTYRIGSYPYSLFRSRGIDCVETPTEEPVPIDWALEKLRAYLVARSRTAHGTAEREVSGI